MSDNSRGSVRGIKSTEVREVIVITLGILLAFGIEAIWTELRESTEVRQQLIAVSDEIEQNLVSLQTLEAEHRAVAEAGAEILKKMGPDAQVVDSEAVAKLIGIFWTPPGSIISSQGALETFRSSGLLATVSDPEIRNALASWSDQLRAIEVFGAFADDRLQLDISPVLHQFISEGDVNLIGGFNTVSNMREEYRSLVSNSRFPSNYSGLLQSRRFENLVAQRIALSLIGVDFAVTQQSEATRILALLAEL